MEAKDTVMTDEQLVEIWSNNPADSLPTALRKVFITGQQTGYDKHKSEACGNCDTPLLREGELYKIINEAEQRGIKEVVDWIDRNRSVFASTFFNPEVETFSLFCDKETWKAQLKKWRVD